MSVEKSQTPAFFGQCSDAAQQKSRGINALAFLKRWVLFTSQIAKPKGGEDGFCMNILAAHDKSWRKEKSMVGMLINRISLVVHVITAVYIAQSVYSNSDQFEIYIANGVFSEKFR